MGSQKDRAIPAGRAFVLRTVPVTAVPASIPIARVSPGCVAYALSDGREYEVELNDDDNGRKVLDRAAELAFHRGGSTLPISSYDIRCARQEISGEEDRVLKLERKLAAARAEIRKLKAQAGVTRMGGDAQTGSVAERDSTRSEGCAR